MWRTVLVIIAVFAALDYFMLDGGGFPKLSTLELLINEVLPALNE